MAKRFTLSSTQEGMLLHHLAGAEPGEDVEQMICVLPEDLWVDLLMRSWQNAVARHDVLRSRFDWTASPPMQEIGTPGEIQFTFTDWRERPPLEQSRQLDEFLIRDRERGFDLAQPPLMRLALFQMGEQDFRLIWTFHHAILDGRSFTLVLREVFHQYDLFCQGNDDEPPPSPLYSDYTSWLVSEKDEAGSRQFWSEMLDGFTAPTSLVVAHSGEPTADFAGRHGCVEASLDAGFTASLQSLARDCEVTLNTVVQAAWSLLLSRYSGETDVVFGVTRACRHVPVDGADRMIGVFINTLPLRVQVEPELPARSFLKRLRTQSVAVRPFEHTPLASVHAWSSVASRTPLFESLVVFERYDLSERLQEQGGRWTRREFHLMEQTNYPVTVYGYAGSRLRLKISFSRARMDTAAARRMIGHLQTLLRGLASHPDGPIDTLPMLDQRETDQLLAQWNQTHSEYSRSSCIHDLIEMHARLGVGNGLRGEHVVN